MEDFKNKHKINKLLLEKKNFQEKFAKLKLKNFKKKLKDKKDKDDS